MEAPELKRMDWDNPTYDEPNIVYRMLGNYVARFAQMGATDKELKSFFKKGPDVTLLDIAKLEDAHTHYHEVQTHA